MESFLDKLDENLMRSMHAFDQIKNSVVHQNAHMDKLANKMLRVMESLDRYKKSIQELEKHFHDDDHQFILSFDSIQPEQFYSKNHIQTYKKSLETQIIKHKYSDILSMSAPRSIVNTNANPDAIPNAIPKKEVMNLSSIEDVDLQSNVLQLPVVKNIQDIQPAFYWYEGDRYYKKGIYICLCNNFYIKVPFPNVLSGNSKEYKLNSVRCKYMTAQDCQANKKKISEIHNSDIRECYYVHKKQKFNKVGSIFRCNIESLGNHSTLDQDLEKVTNFDIKHLLMYSLSDDLLAALWYQNKFKDGRDLVFTNLDIY